MDLNPKSFNLPGWQKVGWHVGKKLRGIFYPPPKKDEPSKDELRDRRLRDIQKGFAYFNFFEEVQQWRVTDVDPLQQANIPLCQRPEMVRDSNQAQLYGLGKSKTILCHDFKGGYIDAEAVRPYPTQHSFYICNYLQNINSFIYFSHHLVSVPPPSWINCLHTNGVKSLGTFIMESQTENPEALFEVENEQFLVVQRLVAMTEAFGFDGWLLNFEKAFDTNRTNRIVDFIESLKAALGPYRVVLWYDSLTIHNKVCYQNSLTHENARFASSVDGIFTNYSWDLDKLEQSCNYAARSRISKEQIYFGIDVWAQNNNISGPPRITYPQKGGGGTGTGIAVRALADAGVSTAIFAPGWPQEHFSPTLTDTRSISDQVVKAMWEGTALPEALECDCNGSPHNMVSYQTQPILRYAITFPAGCSTFFYTDFSSGFLANSYGSSQKSGIEPQIGLQSISPTRAALDTTCPLFSQEHYRGSKGTDGVKEGCLAIKLGKPSDSALNSSVPTEYCSVRLYDLAIDAAQRFRVRLTHSLSTLERFTGFGEYGLYISLSDAAHSKRTEHINISSSSDPNSILEYVIGSTTTASRIREVGVYYRGVLPTDDVDLFYCHALSIIPERALELVAESRYQITNLTFADSTINGVRDQRLQWDWSGDSTKWPKCLPWSKTTGPFSHFSVTKDEIHLGVSQSLAFSLRSEEVEKGTEASQFTVEAFCFAGVSFQERTIASLTVKVG